MASALRSLAAFIVGLQPADIPEKVRETASLCVLDSVSAALGGADNAQNRQVTQDYLALSGGAAHADVWGQGAKAPLLTAAFLNAMMGHTLELDDVHTNSKTHIGTVVVPAAWAMAQYLGSSGEELLTAVVCGYETMARIGMALDVSAHRGRGWHVTATAGTFGAAAACAKLLGLDEDRTVWALGLAGSLSFGTWAFLGDGASCKVLNPARAAASGCEAAWLAKSGMSGPEHILTAEDGGLLTAMSDGGSIALADKDLGRTWELLYMDNKPYPCCRSTHCAIDGALALREAHGLDAADVDHVVVETYLVGNMQCGMSDASKSPKAAVEAKFSTPYTVACALLFGEVSLRQFLPECIMDETVRALMARVSVETAERFTSVYPDHWGCHITVTCRDGRVLEKEITDASGSVDNPLTAAQIIAKATGLLRAYAGDNAPALAREILAVADAPGCPSLL